MDLDLLDRTLADAGEPAFRARQAWQWTAGGAAGFAAVSAASPSRANPFSVAVRSSELSSAVLSSPAVMAIRSTRTSRSPSSMRRRKPTTASTSPRARTT